MITQREEPQASTSTANATDTPEQVFPRPKEQYRVVKKIGLIAATTIGVGALLVAGTYHLISTTDAD